MYLFSVRSNALVTAFVRRRHVEQDQRLILGVQNRKRALTPHRPRVGLVILEPEDAGVVPAKTAVQLFGFSQNGIVLGVGVLREVDRPEGNNL